MVRILIDGKDIRDFGRQDLRSLFGMVLQDTWCLMEQLRKPNVWKIRCK